jgi:hypothetical protein
MNEAPAERTTMYSRRAIVSRAVVATGAAVALPNALLRSGLAEEAHAATPDLVTQTLNGLVAFVVPGPDDYSVAQGLTAPEPGAIAAHAGEALVQGLNMAQATQPTLAASVAALFNGIAVVVDPTSTAGPFDSPFANLAFQGKATVFAVLEQDPSFEQLRSLVGVLPGLAAFLAYSEVGVFDPASRSIVARPVGWEISSYDGVSDGHDEFVGYFENRRKARA